MKIKTLKYKKTFESVSCRVIVPTFKSNKADSLNCELAFVFSDHLYIPPGLIRQLRRVYMDFKEFYSILGGLKAPPHIVAFLMTGLWRFFVSMMEDERFSCSVVDIISRTAGIRQTAGMEQGESVLIGSSQA